jgi:RecB family exonuclease
MMIETFRYATPHAIFHPHFLTEVADKARGRRTIIISANAQHTQVLKRLLTERQLVNISVMTLQAFLIRQLQHQRPRKVLNATSRAMLVQQAWQRADGALWQAYGSNRGALREIGQLLSWISSQRRHWHDIDAEINQSHEVGAIYAQYVNLLNNHDVVGYDDVALHVLSHTLPPLEYEFVVACELQHAQPAQRTVLSRYAQEYAMWLGAWVSHTETIPEQQALHAWLEQHAPLTPWSAPESAGSHLVHRLVTQTSHTLPVIGLIGTRMRNQEVWSAGAATIVDECHAVAHHCQHLLRQGRSVEIVCTDDSLVPHIRAALVQQGIELPPLAPPDYINPIINLARTALRWIDSPEQNEQQRLIHSTMLLPFINVPASTARRWSADPHHPRTQQIRGWFMAIQPSAALAPQIRQLLNQSGAVLWAWESTNHHVDVRDSWLRETQSWLERIDEIDQLAQHHQLTVHQRDQLLLSVDALPAPMRELHRTTLPLTSSTQNGAHAAQDSVIVMGLSEHVAPRATQGFQLIDEATLCRVFHAHVRPVEPALTNPHAWQHRELRRFMSLIASHANHVVLSFAHYGANGQSQLATPYLAQLLDGLATFDRDGHLQVHDPAVACVQTLPLPQAHTHEKPEIQPIQLLTNNSFSASQISTYLNCPRRYYYEKVIQLGHDDDSELDERSLDMGALAHEVLCAVLGTGATENVDLRNESLEAFRTRFATMPLRLDRTLHAAWHGDEVPLPGEGTYRASQAWHQRFGTGLRLRSNWLRIHGMLQRWWAYERALYDIHPNRRPILLEHQLDFSIDGMRIVGRIDRIDMVHMGNEVRYEIIDYKSGKPKAYSDLLNGFMSKAGKQLSNFQIPIYLIGLNQPSWQLTPAADTLTLFYLGQGDKNSQLRSVYVTEKATGFIKSGNTHIGLNLSATDLYGVVQHDLVRIMQQMRVAPYPATPSRQCTYCSYTHICDESQ